MEQRLCPLFERRNHTPCIATDEEVFSYAQVDLLVNTLSMHLKNWGVTAGQRVAFKAYLDLKTILLFFALFRLGAIACPLSTRLSQEQNFVYLNRLQPALVVNPQELPLSFETGLHIEPLIQLEALATFLFTSGSSGVPKIACHSFRNHYMSALGALSALHLDSQSRYLLALPLFHVGGLAILFRCFLQGATVVLSSKPLADALVHHQISHLSLVPTQLYRLVHEPRQPSLKCLLLGGAPTPPGLLEKGRQLGWPLTPTYGMTETSSMVTLGKVLPFRELKIENKEIFVRGATLFQGYWDTASSRVIDAREQGWFATKDLGRFDEKGELEVTGRKDRQFISGGENIQPEEIEQALLQIPGIVRASVLPIDDVEFGARPHAFIEDTTHMHTLDSIKLALQEKLPSFKHPVRLSSLSKEAAKGLV
jgi:O-succinylbenzoic acid--CoA ligase